MAGKEFASLGALERWWTKLPLEDHCNGTCQVPKDQWVRVRIRGNSAQAFTSLYRAAFEEEV